jgi:hypothetical protein
MSKIKQVVQPLQEASGRHEAVFNFLLVSAPPFRYHLVTIKRKES